MQKNSVARLVRFVFPNPENEPAPLFRFHVLEIGEFRLVLLPPAFRYSVSRGWWGSKTIGDMAYVGENPYLPRM